jgi:hypothetical protein
MVNSFFSRLVDPWIEGLKDEKAAARKASSSNARFQTASSLKKPASSRQTNSMQARIADSSSKNAVNFSSARTISNAIGYAEVFQPVR